MFSRENQFYFPGQIRWTGYNWLECCFANYLYAKMKIREKDNYLSEVMKTEETSSIRHCQILGCYCRQ